jgi:pilus assembly protein CpaF
MELTAASVALRTAQEILAHDAPGLASDVRERLAHEAVAELDGLGPLQWLVDDPTVSDVMVNGPGRVFVERGGAIEAVDIVVDAAAIRRLVDRVIAPLGLRIDRATPAVDARLPGGARLHAILPPIAVDGPYVTIRRHGVRDITIADMCVTSAPHIEQLLLDAVHRRQTILVCGATGAGKTTLLNALGCAIPPHERVITIEDAAELRLQHHHVVRLETRPAGADGVSAMTLRDLLRHALRMRPDRFVLGEVRGPEALDMLQALMTGHRGSLATLHATSCGDALLRLETMALTAGLVMPLAALHRQIISAVDLIVLVERVGAMRQISTVAKVVENNGRPEAVPVR